MNEEMFNGCTSGEVHEVILKSYPGERAIGIWFNLVLEPDEHYDFLSELESLLGKYAL